MLSPSRVIRCRGLLLFLRQRRRLIQQRPLIVVSAIRPSSESTDSTRPGKPRSSLSKATERIVMKALLVGMDGSWGTVVSRGLDSRGHSQVTVGVGLAALEAIQKEPPALIIVSDPLGDMSAKEFCRQVRCSPQGIDTVILVITPHEAELPDLLDAGATDLYATSLGPAALEARLLIAERLVVEHARLRDRELRFRRLFDSGVAGVTISNLDGNFKEANASFLQMLGYTREEMLEGKLTWETITPLDHLVRDIEDRLQLESTGFLPLREREFVHKDGRYIATLVGSATLEGTTECISYVTDISERRRTEDALRTSEAQYRTKKSSVSSCAPSSSDTVIGFSRPRAAGTHCSSVNSTRQRFTCS